MLITTGQVLPEQVQDYATVGELALDGSVRPVKGALSMAMAAAERKVPRMLVPAANVREAAVVEDVAVYPVSTLAEAVGIVSGSLVVEPTPSNMDEFFGRVHSYEPEFINRSILRSMKQSMKPERATSLCRRAWA